MGYCKRSSTLCDTLVRICSNTSKRCVKGLVKKYRVGWAEAERGWVISFSALSKGWVDQFSACHGRWVILFYNKLGFTISLCTTYGFRELCNKKIRVK